MNSGAPTHNTGITLQHCVFLLVAAAAALVPLESFLITLAAKTGIVPGKALFASQFAIEGMVYLALASVILTRLITGKGFRRTPADVPLLVILAIVMLSVAVNDAPVKGALMNLRSALRYTAVFYLVTQVGLTRKQISVVLWVILISGAVQVFAGWLQWFAGYNLKIWMLPYTSDIEIAGQGRRFALVERGRELGSLFGTLGDTLYYGLFLLAALAVALPQLRRWRTAEGIGFASLFVLALFLLIFSLQQRAVYDVYLAATILIILFSQQRWRFSEGYALALLVFATAYSYSRAAVIVTGLSLVACLAGRLGVRRVVGACCAMAAVGVILIAGSLIMETRGGSYHHPRHSRRSIMANMTNIFSAEYLERSKRQRLGTVLGVAPTTLMNAPLLGFGPDQKHTINQLNEAEQSRLYKTLTKEGFEDVYWVALLCYIGIAGVIVVLWLAVRLMWTCAAVVRGSKGDPTVYWAGLAGLCIVGQAMVLMWFNRVPEIRSFSFYLWLLPALAYAAWSHQKETQTTDADKADHP